MYLIKLNAIDSTNTYLKAYADENICENFTVVFANEQTRGRGQMNSKWESEKGKNLMFSVLLNDLDVLVEDQFILSMLISIVMVQVIEKNMNAKIQVKWPNDILAERKKIAGILIENSLKGGSIHKSIIGIGLNVNQQKFPDYLNNAISMQQIEQTEFDIMKLLKSIISELKKQQHLLLKQHHNKLKKKYLSNLYAYQKAMVYRNPNGDLFTGKIVDISELGKLVLEMENGTCKSFELKQIQLNEF